MPIYPTLRQPENSKPRFRLPQPLSTSIVYKGTSCHFKPTSPKCPASIT
ncbi:hypothetical protein GCWU000324_01801 [Kingella oralis ATCC 51147]|uniref:Uncharacterized protein n=1 Tax=Kingella oralis ATCC 51147 TaxID=629741 RepID=C4GID1_9NEIS|nr:hypothetical protein GCWU000324_01801 [Kingella oralis ATCC 51147]